LFEVIRIDKVAAIFLPLHARGRGQAFFNYNYE
jgi:hypothetical protein